MKIKQEHYDYMKNKMEEFSNEIKKHREFLVKERKTKDIEKRLRWDLMYMTKLTPFLCNELYPYLNDNHIDTTLKHIMVEIDK